MVTLKPIGKQLYTLLNQTMRAMTDPPGRGGGVDGWGDLCKKKKTKQKNNSLAGATSIHEKWVIIKMPSSSISIKKLTFQAYHEVLLVKRLILL